MNRFEKEGLVPVKFTTLWELLKDSVTASLIANGLQCEIPHKYIREMITGEKEDGTECIIRVTPMGGPTLAAEESDEDHVDYTVSVSEESDESN